MIEREEPVIPVAHVSREDLLYVLPELSDQIRLLDEAAIHEIASQISDALQEVHHLTMSVVLRSYLALDADDDGAA